VSAGCDHCRALDELRDRLQRIEECLRSPEPLCVTLPDAARRLGIGLTKMKQMVRDRQVRTSMIGRVPMVAISELHRVSTPEADRPRLERAQRAKAWVPIARSSRQTTSEK